LLAARGDAEIEIDHASLGRYVLSVEPLPDGAPELVFTENETNSERLFGIPNEAPYVKDAFHEYVIAGRADSVNPARSGTKAAGIYRLAVPAGAEVRVRLRLTAEAERGGAPFADFDTVFAARRAEADAFYGRRSGPLSTDERLAVRQAYAGL